MNLENLRQQHHKLLEHITKEGYTQSYIRRMQETVRWILKNEKQMQWQNYSDIYHDRAGNSKSKLYKKNLKTVFNALQRFDLYGEYPNRKFNGYFEERGAYYHLIPEFKELIDFYKTSDMLRGIKENTIKGNSSGTSCFLCAMQERNRQNLASITEKDVLSFFVGDDGNVSKCSTYKKEIAAVFKVGLDWREKERACRMILAYLPQIRPKRKNIQVLTADEIEAIHGALNNEHSALSLRDRAIGKLLFFTGIRACDIAGMRLAAVDWEAEVIRIPQQKTGQPLVLPLATTVGNAIYDYIVKSRPESHDDHLFLGSLYPHYPLKASSVWQQAEKVYMAASVRREVGDRRGTHLFRHNVATALLGGGVPRPVVSQALGHTDPNALDTYLHADFVHLKTCAISIDAFPVPEEVFML